jgi:hypothetical protein
MFEIHCIEYNLHNKKGRKQAGAELCQAQVKLGLTKLAVSRKDLRVYKVEVTLHSKRD